MVHVSQAEALLNKWNRKHGYVATYIATLACVRTVCLKPCTSQDRMVRMDECGYSVVLCNVAPTLIPHPHSSPPLTPTLIPHLFFIPSEHEHCAGAGDGALQPAHHHSAKHVDQHSQGHQGKAPLNIMLVMISEGAWSRHASMRGNGVYSCGTSIVSDGTISKSL